LAGRGFRAEKQISSASPDPLMGRTEKFMRKKLKVSLSLAITPLSPYAIFLVV